MSLSAARIAVAMGIAFGSSIAPYAATAQTIASVTQFSYDAAGRPSCTAVRMETATFGSLPASACDQATPSNPNDSDDRITRNEYDAAGQLLRVEQGVGTNVRIDYVRYEYTLTGKQKAVTDANGNRAEFAYDGYDRRAKWTFASTATPGQVNPLDTEEYGYDLNGNRISLKKRDNRTIAYSHDALSRVVSKTYPSGGARAVYYSYDLRGLLTGARFDSASGSDAVLSNWDALGRQTSSTTSLGGTSRTLSYTYDIAGNRLKIEHPDGTYAYTYHDGLNRPYYTVVNGPPVIQSYYDAQGRMYAMDRWRASSASWGMGSIYTFDGISRLASQGHWFPSSSANVTTAFTYNSASQLVSRTRNNDDYRFDGYTNVDRSYARNGLNQYSTVGGNIYAYDANGNLTSDGTTSYSYDIENRLTGTSAGVTLTYDPLGRLAQTYGPSTGTTQFLYDGDALVAEYGGPGNMLKRYVHGGGVDQPLVEYDGAGTTAPRYLFADHQGSVIAIADSNGNRIAVNGYDEYGIPNGYAGSGMPNTGRFQYTGQAWIPELGMYHYKARTYSPTLGRFLQTDPVGYDDHINLYAYVGNDPMNGRDPTGMYTCEGTRTQCRLASLFFKGAESASRSSILSEVERDVIKQNLESIGAPGEANGVTVNFGKLNGASGQFTATGLDQGTLTLDLAKIASTGQEISQANGFSKGLGVLIAGASTLAHEAGHSWFGPTGGQLGKVLATEGYAYRSGFFVLEAYQASLPGAWERGMTDRGFQNNVREGVIRSCRSARTTGGSTFPAYLCAKAP